MGVQPSIRHIGKYEVIDVIGTGGMGIVFRAHDPAIGRTVAIKMLRQADSSGGTGVFDRFFSREMKSTGNLHHKNIVTVYDSGEQDGNPYLVMEYLEGDAISKVIAERRPIPLVEKLDVVVQICDGLQYAHDRNIIHRDIKPANVILLADGTAKIVDFGVARIAGGESTIVQAGQLVGSLYYLSPEQINSQPIDARSDIFSAGVLLYEFLTCELPFKGPDPSSTFVKILTEDPPQLSRFVPELPFALQTVVSRALAKNVNDRYQTAEELGFEILSVQKHLTSGIIADCMKRAEAAMQRHDLERARQHLLEVVRLDRQHERANRLLRDVRKAIQQEQRSSQIVQMRSQAQVALAGGQYEEALACADQALKLDPSDRESVRLSDEIRSAITRARAVREALNRAESALFAGDFDEAKDAVEESLRLDPSDSEARALSSVVNKELAERSRRQRVQDFVDQARRGIAERNFGDAVDALHHAEELDPADSNVRELLQWAERGQEQEKRRRYLQEITDQIEKALRNGDFSSACTISEMGLQRFPDDPTLGRLRAISEKQRDIAERRRFVQDQSLAVKILTDQGRLAEAIETLSLALKKYPGEPNLESLLALTRAEVDRVRQEREEAARREEMQRAEDDERVHRAQQVLNASIELRRSLDARTALDKISADAEHLRRAIESADLDEHARNAAVLVLQELDARLQARDQAVTELEQLRQQIEQVRNVASLTDGDNRLRSIKATFPGEKRIQSLCSELGNALTRLRDEHDHRISLLTSLAQGVDATPTGELDALRNKAHDLGAGFADDARIGVLLQQIESSVSARLEAQATHTRDMESLFVDLSRTRSLQEMARIVDRGKSIATLDRSDDNLATRAADLQTEAARSRAFLESLLGEMNSLAEKVTGAATIDDAESVLPQVRTLAERQTDFQDLQEAATRLLAQVHGRRIEHDLITQELESIRATLSTLETEEDLSAAAARAVVCRTQHRNDPTILGLSSEIEATVEQSLRERADLRERNAACDAAIKAAEERLRAGDPNAALDRLRSVEAANPDRSDLHQKIAAIQKQLEQLRVEHERQEKERIAREQAEAEARARAAAVEQALQEAENLLTQGTAEESIRTLRAALERDPEQPQLRVALETAVAELARQRAEAERGEQERIAKERAEAENRERERLEREKAEVERKEQERIAKEKAEQERLAREKIEADRRERARLAKEEAEARRREQEQIAKEKAEVQRKELQRMAQEKAEAEARARQAIAEQAIARARQVLAEGKGAESLRILRVTLQHDQQNQALLSEIASVEDELARQRAELERIGREKAEAERKERERLAKEKAEAEQEAKGKAEAERRERERQERVAKEKAEAERLEQERIVQEKAAAEARARQAATEQALDRSSQSFAHGEGEESLAILLAAMERDPASAALRTALESTRKLIARQQAESERIAKEKADKERSEQARLAREKAAAEQEERERLAKEKAETEKKERDRLSREKAERERLAREKADSERREREHTAKEKAAAEARARLAATQPAEPTVIATKPEASSARPAGAPAAVSGFRRLSLVAGASGALLVVAAGAWFTVRTFVSPAPTVPVTFAITPAGAALTVDGQPKACSAHCTLQLQPGNHSVAVAENGYLTLSRNLTLAKADANSTVNLVLEAAPPSAPPALHPLPGSSLAILGDPGAAAVSLDGKPAGDLATGRVELSQLPAGTHRLDITRGVKDLRLPVRVAQDGSVRIDSATGLDEDLVLAAMYSAGKTTLFCRCNGSELQIDGKKVKPFARNLYRVSADKPQFNVTLVHGGGSQSVAFRAGGSNQATLLITPIALSPSPAPQLAQQQAPSAPVAPQPIQNQATNGPQPPVQTASAQPTPLPQVPAPQTPPAAAPAPAPDLTAWNNIRNSVQISDFQQFVKSYPDSAHASDARQHIAALQAKLEQQQQQAIQQDEHQVLAVLEDYRIAYESKNLTGMLAVFPAMLPRDRSALQRTFKTFEQVRVTFTSSTPAINGDNATISTGQHLLLVVNGKASQNSATILFSLEKTHGRWQITSMR